MSVLDYQRAMHILETPPDDQSSTAAEWRAVLRLKLAEHHTHATEYTAAQYASLPLPPPHAPPVLTEFLSTLLRQSLEHFQSQETIPAQAHLARTLHRQAIVYEAEGSKYMGKAIQAAARETWIAVRESRGLPIPENPSTPLTAEDFDGEVNFWHR